MRNRVQNDQPVIVPVATYPTLPQNGPMPQPRPDATMGAPMAPANPVAPIAPTVPAPATGQMRANAGVPDIRGFTPSELAATARGMYKEPGNAFSAFGQGMMNASALRDQRQREMELADREEAKKQAELAKQQAEQAKQIDYLDRMSPELADAARNGFMTPQEAYTAFRTERANGGKREWTTLDNGDYGWRNAETGDFEVIGNAAKPSTPTDDMREYEEAVRQGYQGTLQDWIIGNKKAGATTINTGDGSSEYNKALDKKYAESFMTIQDGAQAARTKLATLGALSTALQGAGNTGFGGETLLTLQQAGRALGIEIGDVSSGEAARALGNQLALQLRNPSGGAGMPGAMSDKDREFLVASVPGLTKTPEGNAKLVDFMTKVENRSIEVARLAQEYQDKKGQIDNGFYQELSAWSEANPLFPEGDAEGQGGTAAGVPEVGTVVDGYTFKGGDPADPASWERAL
jgi:hypothetical protein